VRILVVTPYPPLRDGIASYAVQLVARLRREGNDVTVLSPGPSAAHLHLDLHGPRGAAALAKRVRGYDRIIVQFHPDFFFHHPATDADRAATALALAATFRLAKDSEIVVHEVDYRLGRQRSPGALAMRAMWRAADRIYLHTESERRDFIEAFGVSEGAVHLLEHGESFVPKTRHDQASARRTLGIPADTTVFLSIGFIQPHKGFDRAIRAFRGLSERGARLYVVGSLRLDEGEYAVHLNELRELAADTPGVDLAVGYVSDELFDRWIVAADYVVLPYRHIWSSGVAERAAIYHRPVIVTRVGGLAEQVASRPDVTLVGSDGELRRAMARAVDGAQAAEEPADWPSSGDDLRERVQAEVRNSASRRRGGPPSRGAQNGHRVNSRSLSTSVRSLPPLAPPPPVSARPGATLLKRAVQRGIGWMVEPVYWQVNALREATVKALDLTDGQLDEVSANGRSLSSINDSGSSGRTSPAPTRPAPVESDG
jgi:glycosyltransferase involved in cell wall biosynthesis